MSPSFRCSWLAVQQGWASPLIFRNNKLSSWNSPALGIQTKHPADAKVKGENGVWWAVATHEGKDQNVCDVQWGGKEVALTGMAKVCVPAQEGGMLSPFYMRKLRPRKMRDMPQVWQVSFSKEAQCHQGGTSRRVRTPLSLDLNSTLPDFKAQALCTTVEIFPLPLVCGLWNSFHCVWGKGITS